MNCAAWPDDVATAAEVFTEGPAQKVGEGYKFTEGPAWHPQEKAFYFSDIPSNNMQRWTAEGGSKLFLDRKSRSNGIVVDPQGRGRQFLSSQLEKLTGTRMAGFVLTRQAAAGRCSHINRGQRSTSSPPNSTNKMKHK